MLSLFAPGERDPRANVMQRPRAAISATDTLFDLAEGPGRSGRVNSRTFRAGHPATVIPPWHSGGLTTGEATTHDQPVCDK